MHSDTPHSVNIYPGIQLKSFGTETILYHPGTGDTILLHPHAAILIQLLQAAAPSALPVRDLIHKLAEREAFELDNELSDHVLSLLGKLYQQEIVYLP